MGRGLKCKTIPQKLKGFPHLTTDLKPKPEPKLGTQKTHLNMTIFAFTSISEICVMYECDGI